MKMRMIICTVLAAALMLCGCGIFSQNAATSDNYEFSGDMAAFMLAYTKASLAAEMDAAGVDTSKSLFDQERDDGESWGDYIIGVTEESIRSILLYSESSVADGYLPEEGMIYKASENVSYVSSQAQNAGMSTQSYLTEVFGKGVTVDGFRVCTEMMSHCEGYELYLQRTEKVTDADATAYADENLGDFTRFDYLRYTTKDKALADELSGAKDVEEYLHILSSVSGLNLTDRDKNGIPDSIEVKSALVSSNSTGEFAAEDGRKLYDTTVTEKDGSYTVKMITSLPGKDTTSLWSFRMIYISKDSSTDPAADAGSYLEQWKEKEGGEDGFANLAARYSDAPSAYYGGLMSGVSISDMPTKDVASFICSSERKAGDTAMVPDGEDGAYILYFLEGPTEKWLYDAVNAVKWNRTEEKMDAYREENPANVTVDTDVLKSIAKKMGM